MAFVAFGEGEGVGVGSLAFPDPIYERQRMIGTLLLLGSAFRLKELLLLVRRGGGVVDFCYSLRYFTSFVRMS